MIGDIKAKATRRTVLGAIGMGAGIAGLRATASAAQKGVHFSHGIASGDPTQNAVILWTRAIDLSDTAKNIEGTWQLATTSDFTDLVGQGRFKTGPKRDFTVKVDAGDLRPGTTYFYRFITGGKTSPVGRTKTLPEGGDPVHLGVVSCSNYSHGHFHVYKEIAARDYQAILHLGDYIYEYAEGKYDNADVLAQGRRSKPLTEAISLDDYRLRYATYRTDENLQAAHAAHPFICIWDDHEVANDTYKDGAENHNEGEGDFHIRQKAAMRAYYEWLPIRENAATAQGKIYRTFELGDHASLIMLDTRHIGRDKPFSYRSDMPMRSVPFDFTDKENPKALLTKADHSAADPHMIKDIIVPFRLSEKDAEPMTNWEEIKKLDPKNPPKGYSYLPDAERFKTDNLANKTRTIMGAEQEEWFAQKLAQSKANGKPWQIIGQQLLTGKVGIPQIPDTAIDYDHSPIFTQPQMAFFRMLGTMGLPFNLDAWDGYAACRERIFGSVKHHANNAVFLAGDTHNAWAFDLTDHDGNPVAVELATPGISSPGLESYIPAAPDVVRDALMKSSPELKYANTKNRGWMTLTISADKVSAQWHFVSSVITPTYNMLEGNSLTVAKGTHKVSKT